MVIRRLALGALLAASPAAAQEVSARIEPATIALGQTAELVVEIEAGGVLGGAGEPRLPDMAGVSIVGRSREARVVMAGGRITRLSIHRFTLLPRAPGTIRIDPIRIGTSDRTLTTSPLRLLVVPADGPVRLGREGAPDPAGPPPVFAVTRVDRRRAWVGEQVTLTFAFYHDPSFALAESPDYDPPDTPGFWRMEIDKDPIVALERLGDRTYHVQRFRYALFPLRAGELAIGPADVRIVEPDRQRWWEPGRSRTISTEPLTIVAESLPSAPPGFAGAVGRFDLTGGLRPRETVEGTPVELELRVRGQGNPSAVGTPILPDWPDIEVRPPTVEAEATAAVDGVRGEKTFRFLLVPDSRGRLSLGAARLPYFDPSLGEYRVDTLRLGEIVVGPGSPASSSMGSRALRGPRLWPERAPAGRRADMGEGLAKEPWTWVALAGPWAAWLLAAGVRGALRRRGRDPARAALAELAVARESLSRGQAASLHRAERSLDAALAARFGPAVAVGAPRERVRALGAVGAGPELLEAVESARASLAAARFAGGSTDEAAAALGRVEALLAARRDRTARGPALLAVGLAGTALALLAFEGSARAQAPVDPADARGAWRAANDAYRAGDFARAASGYEALLATWVDPRLEADLAAARWRQGQRGAALAHYLHALVLDPRASGIRADLARLRSELGDPPDARGPLPLALERVALDELIAILLLVNALAFGSFVGSRARPRTRPWFAAALSILIFVALATMLRAWVVDRGNWAVAAGPVPLLAAPEAPPVGSVPPVATLPAGSVVRVLERGRGSWRVQAPDRPAGWVARDSIVPVDSRGLRH